MVLFWLANGIGGLLSQNQSFVGSHAEDIIKDTYFANKMFFSSKGVMEDDVWVLKSNEQECAIKQKMITIPVRDISYAINQTRKSWFC